MGSFRFTCAVAIVAIMVGSMPAGADTMFHPVVTMQPDIGIVAAPGDYVDFTTIAEGTPAPTVHWQWAPGRDGPWTDLPDSADTTLRVTSTTDQSSPSALGHAFRAVFTNLAGVAYSRPAKLVSKSEWITDLGDEIADVPLNELAISGSHDMGTYGIGPDSADSTDGQTVLCNYIHNICEHYARAQSANSDAYQQLNDGIRYFDLRICSHGDTFVTCHGLEAAPLTDILSQTRAWIDAHPGELVILDFNHHYIPTSTSDPSGANAKLDAEANMIEDAFATADGSLLIDPEYCVDGDKASGTCANRLTLGQIHKNHLGGVIVNFENDGSPGDCLSFDVNQSTCLVVRQPPFGTDFYDRHPKLWGRADNPPPISGYCTLASAFSSCFAGDPLPGPTLDAIDYTMEGRESYTNTNHFFLQFLQTTPDGGYVALHLDGSLLDMALESNPYIGPFVFSYIAPTRPENVNILAINFFDYLNYGSNHFDFVHDVIDLNEYGRTPPTVHVSSAVEPASTGWYNAQTLESYDEKLPVDVEARDYKYLTGIGNLTCNDSALSTPENFGGIAPPNNAVTGAAYLLDGVHVISCTAADGADQGFHHLPNTGAGPGSAPKATFKIDTTAPGLAPVVTPNPVVLGGAGTASPNATDATSGIASTDCDPIDSSTAGDHVVACSATDNAGNMSSAQAHYLVAYNLLGFFSPFANSHWKPGTNVPIKVALADAAGNRITDAEAQALVEGTCRVTFTVTGAQNTVACLQYDPREDLFSFDWKLAKTGTGPATIVVTVTYPGTPLSTVLNEDVDISR